MKRKVSKKKKASPKLPGDRLNKYLASCGLGSRRQVEELILGGRVTINGKAVNNLSTRVMPGKDRVAVNGKQLMRPERRSYFLLNKPKGVLCTNAAGQDRPRAIDFVKPRGGGRLHCVGRLDADSEGLIILTDDGEFTNRLTHPRYEVPKTYFLKVRGKADPQVLKGARQGVRLAEGRTGPMKIQVTKKTRTHAFLTVTIHEGKNRELRRVFAKIGLKVQHLKRVRIGSISIAGLKTGGYRPLTAGEVEKLRTWPRPQRKSRSRSSRSRTG